MKNPSLLYPKQVDLNNCDKEPIHIIGKIQSHGFLFGFDVDSNALIYFSQNCRNLSLFSSKDKRTLYIDDLFPELNKRLKQLDFQEQPKYVLDFNDGKEPFWLIAHKSHNYLVLELEKQNDILVPLAYQEYISKTMHKLGMATSPNDMCEVAAEAIKQLCGYDRVMIYKFDADWNGEIIAENKEDHLESWLGLHYPATDIPQQARTAFLKQGVRMLTDVNASAVPIECCQPKTRPLDLTKAELRAVSPIHIEYLKNMKVGATLNCAIIFQGQLWGLIACHHYSEKFVDYHKRKACNFLTDIFSLQLSQKTANQLMELTNYSNKIRSQLIKNVSLNDWELNKIVTNPGANLSNITQSENAVLYYNGIFNKIGTIIADDDLLNLINFIKSYTSETTFYTHNLYAIYPKADAYKKIASGVLIVFFGVDRRHAIIWFKPEITKEVHWGGNPNKSITLEDGRLTPRKSFEKWSQSKSGFSNVWLDYEIAAVKALRDHVSEIIIHKYEEINLIHQQLEYAYKELETFSYSVSHDLRSPLRGIDGFAQILKEDYYDILDDYGKQSVEIIINSIQKMNTLIDDILAFSSLSKEEIKFQPINTNLLVKQILDFLHTATTYPTSIIEVQSLPNIKGDSSMFFHLLHNLIGNALKYTSKVNQPKIIVGYKDDNYFVKDNGIGFDQCHENKVFGVFNRLVGDEYEGSGIGLAIAKRVIEKHEGKIWVKSKPNKGTTFYFTLNNKTNY